MFTLTKIRIKTKIESNMHTCNMDVMKVAKSFAITEVFYSTYTTEICQQLKFTIY